MPAFHRIPLAVLTTFLLTLPGCADKTPEERLAVAQRAYAAADYTTATIELKNLLQVDPNNAAARVLLAQTLQRSEQWAESEKHLRAALDSGIEQGAALPLLTRTLAQLGKYEEAAKLEVPRTGLSAQQMALLQAERANLFLLMRNPARAVDAIHAGERALLNVGAEANTLELLIAKAKLAITQDDPVGAMRYVDEALRRDAKVPEALYLKAQLHLSGGEEAPAVAIYQSIIASNPQEVLAHLALVEAHLRARDLDKAEKALDVLEGLKIPVLQASYSRAKIELLKGNPARALSVLQPLLKVAPGHMPTLLLDAVANHGLGHYEQSLKSLNRYLSEHPDHAYARKLAATNYLHLGETKQALGLLNAMIGTDADDAEALMIAAEASMREGRYAASIALLERAEMLKPGQANILQGKVRSQLMAGKPDMAVSTLERAVKSAKVGGQADLALIMLHLGQGSHDKALDSIAALEGKTSANALTATLRGKALLSKGDRAQARAAFERALAMDAGFYSAVVQLAIMDTAEGKPAAARDRYVAFLKKNDKHLGALMDLAKLAASTNNETEAVQWLERAAKANPTAIAPRASLARFHLTRNEPRKALAVAREALAANPDNSEALLLMATMQTASGEIADALSNLTKAVAKAPRSAEAAYLLGMAQYAANQRTEGRASLTRALSLDPGHERALDGALLYDIAAGEWARALDLVRQYQKARPESSLGHAREGDILAAQGLHAQAATAYQRVLAKEKNLSVFAKYLDALARSGNQASAEQRLARIGDDYGNGNEVKMVIAAYQVNRGRFAEAARLYESLNATRPGNPAVLNNLAMSYSKTGDARALSTAEQAYKLAPEHPGTLDTYGWLLLEQGQVARGAELIKQAVRLVPESPIVRYHHAVALTKTGKRQEARRELESLLSQNPSFDELAAARALLASLR